MDLLYTKKDPSIKLSYINNIGFQESLFNISKLSILIFREKLIKSFDLFPSIYTSMKGLVNSIFICTT